MLTSLSRNEERAKDPNVTWGMGKRMPACLLALPAGRKGGNRDKRDADSGSSFDMRKRPRSARVADSNGVGLPDLTHALVQTRAFEI